MFEYASPKRNDSAKAKAQNLCSHISNPYERSATEVKLRKQFEDEEIANGVRPSYELTPGSAAEALMLIKGDYRRELVHRRLRNGSLASIPKEFTSHELRADLKDLLGARNPIARGGEDLPNLLPKEIEIARLSLRNSTYGEVTSLRASFGAESGWLFRMVDEYETKFKLRIQSAVCAPTSYEIYDCFKFASPSPLDERFDVEITSMFYEELDFWRWKYCL